MTPPAISEGPYHVVEEPTKRTGQYADTAPGDVRYVVAGPNPSGRFGTYATQREADYNCWAANLCYAAGLAAASSPVADAERNAAIGQRARLELVVIKAIEDVKAYREGTAGFSLETVELELRMAVLGGAAKEQTP